MAELEQRELETPVSTSSPVTSTTPATKPAKNPKRVAAGKLAAEKTKQAREAQKKASIEAAAIIAKEKEKKSAAAKRNVTPPVTEAPPESRFLTTNQWICLLGIGVAIVTTYVKREDIKAFINEKRSPTFKAPPTLITDDSQTKHKGHRQSRCKDESNSCAAWSAGAYCETNPDYMLANCQLSCKVCGCKDLDPSCPSWAQTGECGNNPLYMLDNCC
ncbi:hypothetical protein ACROYT_G037452 [Oculina patagonica]